jgi:YVTN family beta-propeller protein
MSLAAAGPLQAQTVSTTLSSFNPNSMAVNPVTNKVYGAASNLLLALDGASNSVSSFSVSNAGMVAVNPLTNKIYVPLYLLSEGVNVYDGATNAKLKTISVSSGPIAANAIAVNPGTNKIYIATGAIGGGDVLVIDGSSDTVAATISLTGSPQCIAVNPVINKIYVGGVGSNANSVAVIDGSTDSVAATVTDSGAVRPYDIAVNPVTNKVYVANAGDNSSNFGSVTVIDGSKDSIITSISGGSTGISKPYSIAVNSVTNKVYVTSAAAAGADFLTRLVVIDGVTNNTSYVDDPDPNAMGPIVVAVDPLTNKIYVGNQNDVTESFSTVSVFDGATEAYVKTLNGGAFASGYGVLNAVGVNPVTNKIYAGSMVIDGATNAVSTVTDSSFSAPLAAAVDPVTNKIYVANKNSNTVTVIDAANGNATATVGADAQPVAVAVNPAANLIYTANNQGNDVTVIEGTSYNATVTDAKAVSPRAVAVNAVSGQAYVVNQRSNNVTVINGATYSSTVNVGDTPVAVAVNPATNLIYVANCGAQCGGTGSGNISVIDGATDTVMATVSDSNAVAPIAVAVNPLTDQIYVANQGDGNTNWGNITVIQGLTYSTTVTDTNVAQPQPGAIAVNPATNLIYVANGNGNNVTVIDGSSNTVVATLAAGTRPDAVAVNYVTNKIYVTNKGNGSSDQGSVTVIDGSTNFTSTVTDSSANGPTAVAVNPVTNQIYVANQNSNNVSVITEQQLATMPLQAGISPLPANLTETLSPSFNFSASSSFSPNAPTPDNLLFQVDTWQGPWTAATASNQSGAFIGTISSPLQPGFHILYAYSTDGQDATHNTGSTPGSGGMNPLISNITAYGFLVAPPLATPTVASLDLGYVAPGQTSGQQSFGFSNTGGPLAISSITITSQDGQNPEDANDFKESDNCYQSLDQNSSCSINVTFTSSNPARDESATLIITDNSGGVVGSTQTVTLYGSGADPKATPAFSKLTASQTITYGTASINLSGVISASGPLYPPTTETVSITINGTTVTPSIGANGIFSTTFNTQSIPAAPANPYTIKYHYAGDSNFTDVTDTSTYLTVNKAVTAFSGLSSPTITYGTSSISLSGTICEQGSTTVCPPSGEPFSVTINGVTLTPAPTIGANGAFSTSFDTSTIPARPASPYTIKYQYTTDGNFTDVTDTSTNLTVNKAVTAFSGLSSPTISYGTSSISLSGTICEQGSTTVCPPSGEPFSVTINGVTLTPAPSIGSNGAFSTTFNTQTIPAAPSSPYTIKYQYTTDGNFTDVTDTSTTLTVDRATPAFSGLTASQTITYGTASINLSGVISAPGPLYPPTSETVSITINGVTVTPSIGANGAFSTTFNTQSIPAAPSTPYTITYHYTHDADFRHVTDTSTTLTVNKATPAFSNLTPSQTITYGTSSINLSGVISAPGPVYPPTTETVSITINGVTVTPSIGANGAFSTTFNTGSIPAAPSTPYTITYSYTADTNFSGASNTATTLTVNRAGPVFSNLSSPTITYGTATTTLSGEISLVPNSESVSITLNGVVQMATVTSGAFSSVFNTHLLGAAGSPYTITYYYPGDSTNASITDTGKTLTVNKATPAFSNLTASQTITYGASPISLSGVISAPGPLYPPAPETVSITINGVTVTPSIGANGTFSTTFISHTIPASGSPYTISYSYAGDSNFNTAGNSSTSLTVNKANTKTTITGTSPSPSNMGQTVKISFTVVAVAPGSGTPTGNVTVSDGLGDSCVAPVASGSCSIAFTVAGSKILTATYPGDGNFNSSVSPTVTQLVSGFSLSHGAGQGLQLGDMEIYQVTVSSVLGFKGNVTLSCGDLPPYSTCSFLPKTAWVGPSDPLSSFVTIQTSRRTPSGTYHPTVIGTYGTGVPATGGMTQSTTLTLIIR